MNKKIITYGILVIFLLSMLASVYAFSTLSLSKVDFTSNDASLNKPAYLLTVVEDGNEQSAVGTFDNAQIKTSDGKTAKEDLKIEIQNTKNTCEYTFQNSYTPIYAVEMRPLSGYFQFYNTAAKCKELYPTSVYYKLDNTGLRAFCFPITESGKITPLSTPVTAFESTIKLTAAGTTATGTVSNIAAKSAKIGDRAYATWNGNLVSGESCPAPLDSGVMGVKQGTTFTITDKAAYDRYNPDQEDLKACLGVLAAQTSTDFQKCVDAYNAKSNAVMQKTAVQPFAAAQLFSDGTGAGKARITLPNLVQYPVISMRVDANWLGIYLPVGKPEIVSLTATDFTEASTGNIRAVIKNVGEARASFSISTSCEAPLDRTGVSRSISLDPGKDGFVDLPLSGETTGSAVTSKCTVTAIDTNQPDNKDIDTVSVTVKPLALCEPLQKRCTDKTIEACNAEGTLWVKQEVCVNGCATQDGTLYCSNPTACTTDSQCDDHDVTTLDQCVGNALTGQQCKNVPIGLTDKNVQYIKIGIFAALLAALGAATFFLIRNEQFAWAIVTGLFAGGAAIGVIVGVFALFSTIAAWLFVIGLILLLLGAGTLQVLPVISLPAIALGLICFIISIILVVV